MHRFCLVLCAVCVWLVSRAAAGQQSTDESRPNAEAVTYCKQIARIVQNRCIGCHRAGEVAPFSLTSYDDVAAWADTIVEVLREERMPPWHASPRYGKFANDARMSEPEKQQIYAWVAGGRPEGDRRDLPDPPEFPKDWRIGEPDLVITMPEAFTVPAKGVVDYKYFVVDPGLTEDRWVGASEVRPGAKTVVHHGVVFVQPPGGPMVAREGGLGFEMIAAFAPGTAPQILPDGVARLLPAGSKLVFQMHYTPDGTERTDQTSVAIRFADPRTVKKQLKSNAAINFMFRLPPGAKDQSVEAAYRFSQDTLLYTLLPHMHLRGKSFRIEAAYPDGSTEVLLEVPRWNFNWQHVYQLAEPKLVPEGTKLRCVGVFDNSADNKANPDPNAMVTFGLQTWQEMMVGYFDMALDHQDLSLGEPAVEPTGDGRYQVTFRFHAPGARSVHLAGSFNDWKIDAQPMDGPDDKGWFTTRITVDKGNYEYKFVLDGQTWKHDPGNRRQKGFYNNSLLVVGAK